MAIFPKFFGDIIILIIRVNADERIKKNYDIFSIKDHEYTFVCFLSIQSLEILFYEEMCRQTSIKTKEHEILTHPRKYSITKLNIQASCIGSQSI